MSLHHDSEDAVTKEKNRILFPYDIKAIEPEINERLKKSFPVGNEKGFFQIGPKNYLLTSQYVQMAENIYNFEIRNDDVFIMTFMRSGTTMTQEMVWLLCNDFDYQKSADIPLQERVPFLEFYYRNLVDSKIQHPPQLTEEKGRRFIKTHLPFSLMPPSLLNKGCKIIYVIRNPKDVAVSYYHFQKSIHPTHVETFEELWYYFKNNLIIWTPYWEHVKEGWKNRDHKNVLLLFYEDIVKNLRSNVEKISTFLGKSCKPEELDGIERHLNIDNFKTNKSVNGTYLVEKGYFPSSYQLVRNGKNGGWREYFNEEMEKEADQWIEENLRDTDIQFPM